MLGKDHALAAAAATLGTVDLAGHVGWLHPTLGLLALSVPVGVAGGLLPDIDHPHSLAGRASIVAHVPGLFGRHRSRTHSLLAVVLVTIVAVIGIHHPIVAGVLLGLLACISASIWSKRIRRTGPLIAIPLGALVGYLAANGLISVGAWLPLAVATGMLSHLVTDSLTPGGVPWLWPLRWRGSIPLFQTGGKAELFVVRPLLVVGVIGMVVFVGRPLAQPAPPSPAQRVTVSTNVEAR